MKKTKKTTAWLLCSGQLNEERFQSLFDSLPDGVRRKCTGKDLADLVLQIARLTTQVRSESKLDKNLNRIKRSLQEARQITRRAFHAAFGRLRPSLPVELPRLAIGVQSIRARFFK